MFSRRGFLWLFLALYIYIISHICVNVKSFQPLLQFIYYLTFVMYNGLFLFYRLAPDRGASLHCKKEGGAGAKPPLSVGNLEGVGSVGNLRFSTLSMPEKFSMLLFAHAAPLWIMPRLRLVFAFCAD